MSKNDPNQTKIVLREDKMCKGTKNILIGQNELHKGPINGG